MVGIGLGIGIGMRGRGGAPAFTLTATTTAPDETVTLQRITPTGQDVQLDWGDGATETIAAGNTAAKSHVYAEAGAYTIRISDPHVLRNIILASGALRFYSEEFRHCAILAAFTSGPGTKGTLNSADLAHLPLTYLDINNSNVSGVLNSADMTNWALSRFRLHSGTWTGALNSADMANWHITDYFQITSGGFTADLVLDMAEVSHWNPTWFYFSRPVSLTVSPADLAGWKAAITVHFRNIGLSQAQVDAILAGLYLAFPNRTGTNGDINLSGNAAPSGTVEAPGDCDTGTWAGGNYAYELVNDTCGVATRHWASVTLQT